MGREHRPAVLTATVSVLSVRAVDDVLELFDLLMTTATNEPSHVGTGSRPSSRRPE